MIAVVLCTTGAVVLLALGYVIGHAAGYREARFDAQWAAMQPKGGKP